MIRVTVLSEAPLRRVCPFHPRTSLSPCLCACAPPARRSARWWMPAVSGSAGGGHAGHGPGLPIAMGERIAWSTVGIGALLDSEGTAGLAYNSLLGACDGEAHTHQHTPWLPLCRPPFLTSSVEVSDSHGMDIVFTHHARSRMADPHRGVVTEEEVRSVLANPTVSYVGIDGKQNVLGEVNVKHVRICFVEDNDRVLVITVINRGTRL